VVEEGHVTVHYQVEAAEELEQGTGHEEPNTSNYSQDLELALRSGKAT
jgi:hypothetical protein